jgi:tetratricopeptide (TPR) repeat protein
VEGSIQKSGNRLRIIAQLINVKDGSHLWSHRFDRELEDIFAIQDEISAAIVENMKIELLGEKKGKSEHPQTENVNAYNLYLQGRYFWRHGDKTKSLEYFNKALEADPDYALAYSGIAATYISYAWHGLAPRKDVLPQAKAAALKALELDNTLGEAHAELAFARLIYDWDWTESEREFKRAIELSPSYAYAHWGYAWLLTYIGRHEEAIREAKRAHELDPLDVELWALYGRIYYYARAYEKAIKVYRNILEIYPDHLYTRTLLALALVHNGNYQEAVNECQKLESRQVVRYEMGYVYGIVGETEKAIEILDHFLDRSEKGFIHNATIFFIYAALNNKDEAFRWLERTYDEREAYIGLLKVEPMFDNLRSDPRFQDLIDRMNFPVY